MSPEEIDALSPAEKEQLWIDGDNYIRRTEPAYANGEVTVEQTQVVMGMPASDEPQGAVHLQGGEYEVTTYDISEYDSQGLAAGEASVEEHSIPDTMTDQPLFVYQSDPSNDIVDAEILDSNGKIVWPKHERQSPIARIIEGLTAAIKNTERLFEAEVPLERQTHILHFMYLARDELLQVEDQYGGKE